MKKILFSFLLLTLVLASALVLGSCGEQDASGKSTTLYVYNWGEYIADGSDDTIRSESSFAVVDSAGCPSVLAEQCFVTNEADTAAFGDDDGCTLAAKAYYLAILDYFGENELSKE